MRRRKEFKDLITANGSLTYSHYWRLVALASVDFCFTIPLGTFFFVLNVKSGVAPWISWDDTHWGYSRVFQFPTVVPDDHPMFFLSYVINQWTTVLCAFLFFGFASEAMENYRLLASTVAKRLGFKKPPPNSPPDQPPAMNISRDNVPQISESVLDLASVGRSSIADALKSVYPDDALDQV